MNKRILVLSGILSALLVANNAPAYVKTAGQVDMSNMSTGSTSTQSIVGGAYIAGGLLYVPTFNEKYKDYDGNSEKYKFESAYGIRAALGTSINQFRIEGEFKYIGGAKYTETEYLDDYMYSGTYSVEAKDSQIALMANGYYDFSVADKLSAFATIGIGMLRSTEKVTENVHIDYYGIDYHDSFEHADNLFAFQVGGGVSYMINAQISADFSYRYTKTSKTKDECDFSVSELGLGIRYRF